MVITIEGTGTPEEEWLPYLESLKLPRLALDPPPAHAVVAAPHPDDEVLGVGGLIALLAAAGTRVDILAVTDGEASHPGGSVGPHDLATRRVAESVAALGGLGMRDNVRRLRLPDGGGETLEQPVAESLLLAPGTWLFAPWVGDGHPDHAAVGRGCLAAALRDGARLLAYPVWAWHWASPGDLRVPWARALQIDLPVGVRAAKARSMAEFITQTKPLGPEPANAPVLPPHVLARFARPWEVVFG